MKIRQFGVLEHDRERATPGFTLILPDGHDRGYLLDMAGEPVHTWATPLRAGSMGRLLPGGDILLTEWPDADGARGREADKVIREYDWDGKVVHETPAPAAHHDFQRLANGNTLYIGFQRLSPEAIARIQGGVSGSELDDGGVLGDYIREVSPDGETVWEWNVEHNMEIEKFHVPPLSPRDEFAHANAVDVLENGDLLVSFRHSSWLFIIERETKNVRWSMNNPLWGGQHDCQMLDNGNILIFANGHNRPAYYEGKHVGAGVPRSRIIEINPDTGEEAWAYQADPPWEFHSQHAGVCQRLWSGNTLIFEGEKGCVFEVTPEGETVWEYVSPYQGTIQRTLGRWLRGRRYAEDSAEIDGRVKLS